MLRFTLRHRNGEQLRVRAACASLLVVLAAFGCAKSPPPITAVQGRLLLDDKPLAFALVEFYPELTKFGSEMNSSAVTDEKGEFKLTCHANGLPGAAVGTHRVVVIEGPPPEGTRGHDGQNKLGEYMSKLTNRPIPETYGSYGKTPLRVEVTTSQESYTLHMKR